MSSIEPLKNFDEYKEFALILKRCLEQRGRRRKHHIAELQDFFCHHWKDTMKQSQSQLKEMFNRNRALRTELLDQAFEHKREADDLERKCEKITANNEILKAKNERLAAEMAELKSQVALHSPSSV